MGFEEIDSKFKIYRMKLIIWNVLLFVSFIILFVTYISESHTFQIIRALAIMGIVTSIAILGVITAKWKEMNDKIFECYLLPRLKKEFKEFHYNADSGVDESVVKHLNFIGEWNKITIDNHIQGYYRDVSFVESGVLCEYEYKDFEGDIQVKRKFSGRVIVIGISLFEKDEFVEIVSQTNSDYHKPEGARKTSLIYDIENTHNIYVSNVGITLPESFLNHLSKMVNSFTAYEFNVRIEKDRVYLAIKNIERRPYSIDSIKNLDENSLDMLIKKDSYFITNTISSILGKGE